MSDQLYRQIRQNFEQQSTRELRRVVAERDSGEWSEAAIRIAEELLAERPDHPHEDNAEADEALPKRQRHSILPLTDADIASYRAKIRLLGWAICIIGVIFASVFFIPIFFGSIDRYSLASAVLGVMIALLFLLLGSELIRLNPQARIPGLVLSLILLLFFPVGTIIGICGILWLGKGGDAMTAAPDQTTNDTAPQK